MISKGCPHPAIFNAGILAASIISLFILQFIFLVNSISQENNIKSYSRDSGVLSLMYHRFNENKYPSTNIRMDMFDEQMKIIKNQGYEFYDPNNFLNEFDKNGTTYTWQGTDSSGSSGWIPQDRYRIRKELPLVMGWGFKEDRDGAHVR